MERPPSAPAAPAERRTTVQTVVSASTPWDEVVRSHAAFVLRLAYHLTRNKQDAEDLSQEVFVRVFRNLATYRPDNFNGWLYRITMNLFRDHLRREHRATLQPLRDDFPAQDANGRGAPELLAEWSLEDDVVDALNALHPSYRDAVVLCDIHGLSYGKIAEVLGIRPGTVASRIHRGRAHLRTALAHRAPPQRYGAPITAAAGAT